MEHNENLDHNDILNHNKIIFHYNNINDYKTNDGYTSSKFDIETIKSKHIKLKFTLNEQKENISKYDTENTWDTCKKYTNEFEAIYSPNLYSKKNHLVKINPLSRSFFKMYEMITDFDLCLDKNQIKVCCLAEGPGGFMEALLKRRHILGYTNDLIYAITLKAVNKNIPGWKKAKRFLSNHKNQINISYGYDGTGNIYYPNNLEFLQRYNIKDKCDIITADGGFDFSRNFDYQEELCFRLLLSEIYGAFIIQKEGGAFLCKFYDIFTDKSILLLYMLSLLYSDVYVVKPYTSRPANSEKYIVCKNFLGDKYENFNELKSSIRKILLHYKKNEKSILQIININIPPNFYYRVYQMNKYFVLKQIFSINKSLLYIDIEKSELSENIKKNIQTQFLNQQINLSEKWCIHYNMNELHNQKKNITKNEDIINK